MGFLSNEAGILTEMFWGWRKLASQWRWRPLGSQWRGSGLDFRMRFSNGFSALNCTAPNRFFLEASSEWSQPSTAGTFKKMPWALQRSSLGSKFCKSKLLRSHKLLAMNFSDSLVKTSSCSKHRSHWKAWYKNRHNRVLHEHETC